MSLLESLVMENLTGSETTGGIPAMASPPFVVLDYLVPGFSVFSSAVQTYLGINLNLYIPLLLIVFGAIFVWEYVSGFAWGLMETYLMSSVTIRTDDEIYNMIMMWIARQKFAKSSRRFIVNTNINSRSWFLWRSYDEEEDEADGEGNGDSNNTAKKKSLQYTPSFGTHFFWYGNYLLLFERHENREQNTTLNVSEREELSIKCFGRNPAIIKKLLLEARDQYLAKDDRKTLIYRGAFSGLSGDPSWQRCMARSSRPFSTVILNEKVKKDLVDDVTDYLNPETRRWYANRGIPYRRGYLLYGPPGTGKSSLSLALAGFFQMKIYIVSLSSVMANEENLSSLFADLPRRCVVLLEDIDSAGLTHTREDNGTAASAEVGAAPAPAIPARKPNEAPVIGSRLSLSGLLNILDGVASQEGRVLIMTTNHLEKLDKALIRPGRVDMVVKFGLADADMSAAIFRAIYAPYEGELQPGEDAFERVETVAQTAKRQAKEREDETARVDVLAEKFAARMPEHEFSPAEIQGLLLRNKRDPEGVIGQIDEWVVQTRKDKKIKEIEDAEKRRKEDEKRKKKEAKAKRKEERRKARKKKKRAEKRKNGEDSSSDDDNSDSDSSSSEDEAEKEKDKDNGKDKEIKPKADASPEIADVQEKSKSANTEEGKNENDAEKNTTETQADAKVDNEKKSPSDSGYDT